MNKAMFTIVYDGPALREGVMDVRDLAPALLSVGQLFDASNRVLHGKNTSVRVRVQATKPGSFQIVLELGMSLVQQVAGILKQTIGVFSGQPATAAANFLGIVLSGSAASSGLFLLIKRLRGRTPESIKDLGDGQVEISIADERLRIRIEILKLYQDLETRDAASKLVAQPLQQPGIESFGVQDAQKRTLITVSKAEAPYFASPELEEELITDVEYRSAFAITSLSFKEDNKWRLNDGKLQISALIRDEEFLHRVDANQEEFAKGDLLLCKVRMRQWRSGVDLKTEYEVIQVLEHRRAARQIVLPITP